MLRHQDSKAYSILGQLLASGVRLLLIAFAYGPVHVSLTDWLYLALQCSVKNSLLYLADKENPITLLLQNRHGFIMVKSCILFKIVKTFLGYTTEHWLVTSYTRFQNTSHSDCYKNKEILELFGLFWGGVIHAVQVGLKFTVLPPPPIEGLELQLQFSYSHLKAMLQSWFTNFYLWMTGKGKSLDCIVLLNVG